VEKETNGQTGPSGNAEGTNVSLEDGSIQGAQSAETTAPADALLIQRIRRGDTDAGHRFVREYYPGIYRYLLYLTGRAEAAEDLTQETFLRAWRRLDTFREGAPFRPWLHRIAHREFLQALRSQRLQFSLEEVGELPNPRAAEPEKAVELRVLLGALPVEDREMVVLHYLEGYEYAEIAHILSIPVGRVRHRLSEARARLAVELGEGDLIYLNEPAVPMRQWAWLPLDQIYALQARLSMGGPGGRALGAGDRGAPEYGASQEEAMERREFLRHVAVGAAGLMLPEAEKDVVDSRLMQKATLAFKGTALSDVCEHLRAETSVHVAAGASVADEKVTLFCEKLPLREVMRQLSRPFGYTWLRSGKTGEYRYELVQDLRSQLLEEELRNRDRNAALLSLEREVETYRPYLDLSPDEALARAKAAGPAEKKLLEKLAGFGWGPIQMYFRLSPGDLAALRAGEQLSFSQEPKPGEQPLSADLARRVVQSFRDWRLRRDDKGIAIAYDPDTFLDGVPPATVPEVRTLVTLALRQSELGQFTLGGSSGLFTPKYDFLEYRDNGPYAVGMSPTVLQPDNTAINARLARDPALRGPVTVRPQPSCLGDNPFPSSSMVINPSPGPSPKRGGEQLALSVSGTGARGGVTHLKVTSADVLEVLHRATGRPVVADSYTRLYELAAVSLENQPLFDALNRLADAMRLRWNQDGAWLQFRSTSFYDDRLKEVPNRLLARWSASRRRNGSLSLDELIEIAQLPDAQLDGSEMAEGARDCWGLPEWRLPRSGILRGGLLHLARFTPEQRQEMMTPAGLPFSRMSLAQQQGFLARLRSPEPLQWPEDLAGATLRVQFTRPGWFTWRVPGFLGWIAPLKPLQEGRRLFLQPVLEQTRERALQAARHLAPQISEAALQGLRRFDPQFDPAQILPDEGQIVPTELDLAIIYVPGSTTKHPTIVLREQMDAGLPTYP
jgi:RNA polymerase sigma-70 factor, ECF subfamily